MTRKEASPLPLAALVSVVLSLGVFLLAGGFAAGSGQRPSALTPAAPAEMVPPQPLAFEPARGGDRYLARGAGYELSVGTDGTRLTSGGASIRTRLVGARGADAQPSQRQKLVVNRFKGAKRHWRTGIPTFGRVSYGRVYPGIDLTYHGRGGALEYDFVLRPGADPSRIELALSGADRVHIDAKGDLVASLGQTTFRQHRPVAYQGTGAHRSAVRARFVLREGHVRFDLGRYDHSRPLVIDPTLTYSDFIGGVKNDTASRVAVDSAGNVYVVGQTTSSSIPGTSASRSGTDNDAFVLRIAPDHTRTWITYLGGSDGDEFGNDIGLDAQGRPYIVGTTGSNDFPDGNTAVGLYGPQDSFTAALSTNGTIRWAHTLGIQDGSDNPLVGFGNAIAVEGGGTSYIALTGQGGPPFIRGDVIQWDASGNFTGEKLADAAGTFGTSTVGGLGVKPGCMSNCTVFYAGAVTHSLDCPGGPVNVQQGYIAAWNFSSGTNPWGTDAYNYYVEDCVGGVEPFALDVNHAGDPVMAGQDSPPANPTVKPHAFFARYVGANGAYDPLPFSTSTETTSNALDVAHDARDNFIIVGSDSGVSGDLQGAIQPTYNGGASDGVVLKIFPDGAAGAGSHDGATIVFASLFGGTAADQVVGAATDAGGNIYLAGGTNSLSKFPTQSTTQAPGISGSLADGFIAVIRPTLAQITGGPSGKLQSRDAKFTFSAGPEPGFGFSAEEVGAKFECRLTPRDAGFGACPANGYTGLADGSYRFEVRATDTGGTSAGTASREFQVDTAPHPSFTIAPNPALAGRPVTFDGSASTAGTPISKFEWDLDGNGSFETNSGTTATATQTYPNAGSFNIALRITDGEARTETTSGTLQVNAATGPGSQFGVSIENGAQFTNSPDVVVTSTFPSFTTSLLFSNDGGFGKAQTFAPKKETKWKLDSSGPERLPKTIYVRFLSGAIPSQTFQDDIILDETPPKVDQAAVAPAAPASAGTATASKLRKFRVKMKASDKTSGVSKVQVTANKRKPGKALKYKRKFVVKAAKRPKWVRARDRAGNWSKWKKAR